MKKNIITSVEITDSHIKVLQSKTLKGKTVVCSSDIHNIKDHSDEEIERILVDVFEAKNISQEDIVFVIPRRFVFMKHMRLPSNNDIEIKKMIGLQLVNKIPYSQDEIFFKPYILEKEKSGYTKLLVLIVHKEIVARYLKIFDKIGIVLSKVTLSSIGILNWFIYQESKNRKKMKGAVLLINIDVLNSELCFCVHDKLVFSRSVNYGAKDLNADKLGDIVEQIKLSIDTYRKEKMGPDIGNVKILSDLREAVTLRDILKDELNLDIEVVAPFENILCQKNMNVSGVKNLVGISLTVGLGILLSDIRDLINFTPQEVHDNKKEKQIRVKWIRFFVLFVL
ncbi:MAG: pilus assembly protein PilM, partial [Candidatus Omnitrophica bacterium]|nr:pilus assembly protein PilM [Candidatus Omnitrophota bacterium]